MVPDEGTGEVGLALDLTTGMNVALRPKILAWRAAGPLGTRVRRDAERASERAPLSRTLTRTRDHRLDVLQILFQGLFDGAGLTTHLLQSLEGRFAWL